MRSARGFSRSRNSAASTRARRGPARRRLHPPCPARDAGRPPRPPRFGGHRDALDHAGKAASARGRSLCVGQDARRRRDGQSILAPGAAAPEGARQSARHDGARRPDGCRDRAAPCERKAIGPRVTAGSGNRRRRPLRSARPGDPRRAETVRGAHRHRVRGRAPSRLSASRRRRGTADTTVEMRLAIRETVRPSSAPMPSAGLR